MQNDHVSIVVKQYCRDMFSVEIKIYMVFTTALLWKSLALLRATLDAEPLAAGIIIGIALLVAVV